MHVLRMVFAAALIGLTMGPGHASTDEFDAERLISDLEERLKVTSEELDRLKPVIEKQSRDLKNAIDKRVEQGFVELEAMSEELRASAAEAEARLNDALNSEQIQELKRFLAGLDEEAIEAAREAIVEELTKILELTQEQLERLRPILKEDLTKLSELLSRFARQTEKSFEQFQRDFEALRRESRRKLEDALDADQWQALERHYQELEERIRKAFFTEG